jgi:uncharacterized membrane protein required for colicin V production
MKNITSSATKIVLLYITFVLGLLTTFAGFIGIWRGTLDPKEVIAIFGTTLTFIIGYYFSNKDKKEEISSPVVE